MLQGGHGQQPRVFHHHFVVLHDIQEGVHQLVVVDGNQFVHMLLYIGEDQIARRFDRHAVGNGLHLVQGNDVSGFQAGLHGGRAGGLHADDLHIGVE